MAAFVKEGLKTCGTLSAIRLKLITFDVTNTLIKVIGSPALQYSEVASTFGVKMPPEALGRVYLEVWRKRKKELPNYGRFRGQTVYDWWTEFVHDVFLKAGYKGNTDTLIRIGDTLFHQFEEASNWEVLPHVKETLESLKSKPDLQLGIISNFDDRLEGTLRKTGLRKYFDFCVTSSVCDFEKPDSRIYTAALGIAGAKPEGAFHVGDDVENDYRAARKAGMQAVLLKRRDVATDLNGVDPNYVISDLSELEKCIFNKCNKN